MKKITYYILQGLKVLHASKINHRDIKPANILINSTGVAKLADFGISKIATESASASRGFAVGTMRYLPPERVQGKGYGFNADIWALGIILYECATGHHPFCHQNANEENTNLHLLTSIMTGEIPPLPENYSTDFKEFVTTCLERNPEKRPIEDQLFEHKWLHGAAQIDLRPYTQEWLHPEAKKELLRSMSE